MTEYKSEVKKIYYPQENVYGMLSDLRNLSVIREKLDDPQIRQAVLMQAGDKITLEQMDSMAEKIKALQFETDFVSSDTPVGHITLRIVEREEPKTIKYALEGAPIQANMWIQLLPSTPTECALRVTLKAELNFFVRQMIGSKLQNGVDGLATMLAGFPYNM